MSEQFKPRFREDDGRITIEISVPDSLTERKNIKQVGVNSSMVMVPQQWVKREARWIMSSIVKPRRQVGPQARCSTPLSKALEERGR